MKRIHPCSQSAFLSPRVFLFLVFFLTTVCVTLVGCDQKQKDETRAISPGLFDLHTIAAGATPCAPPPSGLVSWWPGDGNANDIQDGNNGMPSGGVTFGLGEVGQAFSFDGTTGSVIVPDSNNLDVTTQFTLDAWINPASLQDPTPARQGGIISKVGGPNGNH